MFIYYQPYVFKQCGYVGQSVKIPLALFLLRAVERLSCKISRFIIENGFISINLGFKNMLIRKEYFLNIDMAELIQI